MGPTRLLALVLFGACTQGASDVPLDTGDSGQVAEEPPAEDFDPVERAYRWVNVRSIARVYLPEDLTGLVWVFHGSGGDLRSVQQIEWIDMYNQLIERGIGVALTESEDRRNGRWTEEDVDTLREVFDGLTSDHGVPADIPMGAMAFSNGSNMVPILVGIADDYDWNLRAASVHQGKAEVTAIPTMYVAAENDEVGRTEEFYRASGIVEACRQAVGDCPLRVGREVALKPERFQRVPDVPPEMGVRYFQELVALDMVSTNGRRLVAIDESDALDRIMDRFTGRTQHRTSAAPVATQLRVVWATHRFSSQYAEEEADFLLGHME